MGALIASVLKGWMLAIAAERLTLRLRSQAFKNVISQEASYHDMKENARGAITSRLAADAALVPGLVGGRYAFYCQVLALVGTGCGIALAACPKVGGLALGLSPIIAVGRTF